MTLLLAGAVNTGIVGSNGGCIASVKTVC